MQPPLPSRIMRSAASRPREEYAGQIHVDHGLPLGERELVDDRTVFDLHEQAVAQDSRIRDGHVEPAEVGNDAVERRDHVRFDRDVGGVRGRAGAALLARAAHGIEPGGIEVDERQVRAPLGKPYGHRRAQAATSARDQYRLTR